MPRTASCDDEVCSVGNQGSHFRSGCKQKHGVWVQGLGSNPLLKRAYSTDSCESPPDTVPTVPGEFWLPSSAGGLQGGFTSTDTVEGMEKSREV